MKFKSFVVATLVATATPASAEEWLVVKYNSDAWAYEKNAMTTNEVTGFVHVRLARYFAQPQVDGNVSYQFDIRRYQADCTKRRVRQISNERMTKTGMAVASAELGDKAPWLPASSDWPLMTRWLACDGPDLKGAVKSTSKAAAMVAMMGLGPPLIEIEPRSLLP